ncbi:MAG: hypothetical protein ACR2HX_17100 [Pyrinomonadaceae bacterium]
MKLSKLSILVLILLVPQLSMAQTPRSAQRAWKPFFAAFKAAVNKRDRDALSKMMTREFYYLSSGGDENDNNDTRDEAFEYWDNSGVGAWEALDKVLAQGTVANTNMREFGSRAPSRIAPPIANNRRAIKARSFKWYVVFEFRNGRWYCTGFTECCD